jgi:carbon-monoxide dehydrogenase medium subunit
VSAEGAFARPPTLAAATALLREHGAAARPVCGGTAVALLLRQRLIAPALLVGIGHLDELNGIRLESDGSLRIGAAVRVRDAERHAAVRAWNVLYEALHAVATPRIRHMATIGGGLSHADPAGDPAVALAALDAVVRIAGTAERRVSAADFARDYYETDLRAGELVVDVNVPPLPARTGSTYIKYLPRTVEDYGTVNAAAVVTLDAGGNVAGARLVLGAVGPRPIDVPVAEALLNDKPDANAFARAAALARDLVDPLDDVRGSAAYKRDMAVIIGRRALERAASLATER